MNCHEAEAWVAAYADGELEGLRKYQIEKHVRRCADCAQRHEALLALRARLRAEVPYFAAPPGLRERIRAAVANTPAAAPLRSPRERWQWLTGGALAGCTATLVALVIGTSVLDWRASRDVVAEAVGNHVRATLDERLIQVASSDQHTVKPWLSARLDYSPPVRDFASDGFPLTGGRVDMLDGRPVATLVYGYRKHTIDVFVRPKDDGRSLPLRTQRGFNVAQANGSGWEWIAVSDASADVLTGFVQRLARQSTSQYS
jgi:anti-sigma factor RsiW